MIRKLASRIGKKGSLNFKVRFSICLAREKPCMQCYLWWMLDSRVLVKIRTHPVYLSLYIYIFIINSCVWLFVCREKKSDIYIYIYRRERKSMYVGKWIKQWIFESWFIGTRFENIWKEFIIWQSYESSMYNGYDQCFFPD